MSISITRNINISGYGMPMMGMMPMGGMCCRPAMPIFGGYCTPMMSAGGAMMAGACVGAALANPGVLNAIGSGLKWGYNHILKPVWNSVIKPAGLWVYNNILKPIGSGLKWVWDHTLGRLFKKRGASTSKENAAAKEVKAE